MSKGNWSLIPLSNWCKRNKNIWRPSYMYLGTNRYSSSKTFSRRNYSTVRRKFQNSFNVSIIESANHRIFSCLITESATVTLRIILALSQAFFFVCSKKSFSNKDCIRNDVCILPCAGVLVFDLDQVAWLVFPDATTSWSIKSSRWEIWPPLACGILET